MKVELVDGVYLVASGRFNYTHPADCNVYLVRGSKKIVLVDSGCGFQISRLLNAIRANGCRPEDIDTVLLTHSHWDHARGASTLARRYGTETWVHPEGRQILEEGPWMEFHVAPSKEVTFTPVSVARTLDEGEEIDLGDRLIKVLHTPGHSPDSVCFLLEEGGRSCLFSGDTVSAQGKPGVMTADTDFRTYRDSVKRLASLGIDELFPGHGIWLSDRASEQIEYLADRISGKWTGFGTYPQAFDSGVWAIARHPELFVDDPE